MRQSLRYEVSVLKGDSAFKKEVYWNHLTSFITITIPGSENLFMCLARPRNLYCAKHSR